MSELALISALGGLVAGLVIGKWSEGRRWAGNADRIQRIEWRGRLFKVQRDE